MPEILKDSKGKVIGLTSTWSREDIISASEEFVDTSSPLTEDEIEDVFYSLVDNFDAESGINWDIILCAIEDVFENRDEKEEEELNAKT